MPRGRLAAGLWRYPALGFAVGAALFDPLFKLGGKADVAARQFRPVRLLFGVQSLHLFGFPLLDAADAGLPSAARCRSRSARPVRR